MKALLLPLIAALSIGAMGCTTDLFIASPAPPERQLRQEIGRALVLSEGVAAAVTCSDWKGSCKDVRFSIDNPNVAHLLHAHLATRTNWDTTSGFVIVGAAPGRTKLHIESSGGSSTYSITVVPAKAGDGVTAL